jgi:hypothetical protein
MICRTCEELYKEKIQSDITSPEEISKIHSELKSKKLAHGQPAPDDMSERAFKWRIDMMTSKRCSLCGIEFDIKVKTVRGLY